MKHCDFRPSGTVSCPICMDGYSEVSKLSCVFLASGFHTASVKELDEREGLLFWWDLITLFCSQAWLAHGLSHISVPASWALQPSPLDPLFLGLPCGSVSIPCIPRPSLSRSSSASCGP